MSNNRLILKGFDELREQLRNLPAHLSKEAGGIVNNHAELASMKIHQSYHERTGNLKQGVKVDRVQVSGFGARARVRSTARHAHLYEYGTQARHTDLGYNRGAMPAGRVFVPIVVHERRMMTDELIAMLEREGMTVSGRA